MIIRYTRQATADLASIGAYIARDRPEAARGVRRRIRSAIDALTSFPEIGRAGRVTGSRELIVPGLPYLVAYRITAGTVDILAIRHGARTWPDRL